MGTVFDILTTWKDLITKVFGSYPLAASLVTLLAVVVFYQLDKEWRPGKRPTNTMLTLIGWAVAVPILGFLLDVLGAVWGFIKETVPVLAKVMGSFYNIYSRHPFLVLGILVVAVLSYFAWRRWRPKVLPNRAVRIAIVAASTVVVAHLLSPIVDLLTPAGETPVSIDKKSTPEGAKTSEHSSSVASKGSSSNTQSLPPSPQKASATQAASPITPSASAPPVTPSQASK